MPVIHSGPVEIKYFQEDNIRQHSGCPLSVKWVYITSNSVMQVTGRWLVSTGEHSPLPCSTDNFFRRYATPLPGFESFEPLTALTLTIGITGKEAQRGEQSVGYLFDC